jgi:hypothetical protein
VCLEERELLAIDGQKGRKKDGIDLEEPALNPNINLRVWVCGRPYQDS